MADVLTWDQVYEQFTQCFGQQDYQGAYDLLTSGRDHLPDQVEAIDYYRLCALARLGQTERVYQMMADKFARGFWYSEHVLRTSPSFAPLQGEAEFERLVQISLANMGGDTPKGGLSISVPENAPTPYPTIIALHGNGQTNAEAYEAWKPAASQGWLVGVPLSSMGVWKGSALWDDYERAVTDVTTAYETMQSQHSVDSARLIVGGFSMGGQTAIQMALEGKLNAKGFIALGPGGPAMDNPEEAFAPLLDAAKARGLRGYIIMGDADNTIPQEAIQRFVGALNDAGIPCGFESLAGLAHVYPANFGEIIARGIKFIEQ